MTVADRRNYNLIDPCPELAINDIFPISVRAKALIIRSNSTILHKSFIQIIGAASILGGIEYHFDNFVSFLNQESEIQGRQIDIARHEAVAWMNRVGQLYYFCTSKFIKSVMGEAKIGSIEAIMPFRNKHSAHRSIDSPRSEDTDILQNLQAKMLSDLGGALWMPRKASLDTRPMELNRENYCLAFQLPFPDGSCRNLVIEHEQEQIMSEGYEVINALLASG